MNKILIVLIGIVVASCNSSKKTSSSNFQYVIKNLAMLVNNDTIYVNEFQFHNANSGYNTSGMMYQNYGDYNERLMGKYESNIDRAIWNEVALFGDDRTFKVITDGLQQRHPPFSSIMVFDDNGLDCFSTNHPVKEELMLLFLEKITNISDKSIQRFVVRSNQKTDYVRSLHEFRGRFDSLSYNAILNDLRNELQTDISGKYPILITYHQRAANCILSKESYDEATSLLKDELRKVSKLSTKYNVQNFHVYERNAQLNRYYKVNENFKLDSGYFYNNIFNLHENCGAFLIIKPDGSYMKYFGENYYPFIVDFLKVNKSQ